MSQKQARIRLEDALITSNSLSRYKTSVICIILAHKYIKRNRTYIDSFTSYILLALHIIHILLYAELQYIWVKMRNLYNFHLLNRGFPRAT